MDYLLAKEEAKELSGSNWANGVLLLNWGSLKEDEILNRKSMSLALPFSVWKSCETFRYRCGMSNWT